MKVLFIDDTHPALRNGLEANGIECDYNENYTSEEIHAIVNEYDGLVVRSKFIIDKPLLEKAAKLKFIARVGAGMENIDVEFAESKGIQCINSPEGNRDAVGEHALGMLLCLMNNICRADREVRQGSWIREGNRGYELGGKTVGIIGFGNMGSAFAQRLKGFEVRVLAYDKYKENYGTEFVEAANSLEDLFENADVISLHLPLTDETKYLVDEAFLSKFKKNIYLINTARGKVVKTDALVAALKSGKVIGAAIDVLEYEKASFADLKASELPEAFDYLSKSDRVVLTPHIAGWTFESNEKMATVLLEKIISSI